MKIGKILKELKLMKNGTIDRIIIIMTFLGCCLLLTACGNEQAKQLIQKDWTFLSASGYMPSSDTKHAYLSKEDYEEMGEEVPSFEVNGNTCTLIDRDHEWSGTWKVDNSQDRDKDAWYIFEFSEYEYWDGWIDTEEDEGYTELSISKLTDDGVLSYNFATDFTGNLGQSEVGDSEQIDESSKTNVSEKNTGIDFEDFCLRFDEMTSYIYKEKDIWFKFLDEDELKRKSNENEFYYHDASCGLRFTINNNIVSHGSFIGILHEDDRGVTAGYYMAFLYAINDKWNDPQSDSSRISDLAVKLLDGERIEDNGIMFVGYPDEDNFQIVFSFEE